MRRVDEQPTSPTAVTRRTILRNLGAACIATAAGCASLPRQSRLPVYDTHPHFFTDDYVSFPLTTQSRFSLQELRDMVTKAPTRPDIMFRWWHEANVTGGVGVQYKTCYGFDNSYLLSVADRYPEQVTAVVILDPDDAASPSLLDRLAREHHIVGMRLSDRMRDKGSSWLDSHNALKLWEKVEELNLAMVLMPLPTAGTMPAVERDAFLTALAPLARRFPKTPIVIDHFAYPTDDGSPAHGLGPLDEALAPFTNVYFKYTWLPWEMHPHSFRPAGFLRRAADLYGAHRLMWGSDMGNGGGTYADRIAHLEGAVALLSPTERRAIMHDVGARLFARPSATRRGGLLAA